MLFRWLSSISSYNSQISRYWRVLNTTCSHRRVKVVCLNGSSGSSMSFTYGLRRWGASYCNKESTTSFSGNYALPPCGSEQETTEIHSFNAMKLEDLFFFPFRWSQILNSSTSRRGDSAPPHTTCYKTWPWGYIYGSAPSPYLSTSVRQLTFDQRACSRNKV